MRLSSDPVIRAFQELAPSKKRAIYDKQGVPLGGYELPDNEPLPFPEVELPEGWHEEVKAKAKRQHNRPYCGSFTLRGVCPSEMRFQRLRCKCWDCPHCGPRKASRYKKAIREQAEKHKLCRFLTLTLDPKKLTAEQLENSVAHLRECWAKLRTYMRRAFGESVKFIAVLEFQKNGVAHLHCLVDRYMSQAWIKKAWSAVGGGEHVDIRYRDIHRVARYLAKYLTKELLMSAPKRSRRVTVSRGLTLNEKPKKTHDWDILKAGVETLCGRFAHVVGESYADEDCKVLESFIVQWSPQAYERFSNRWRLKRRDWAEFGVRGLREFLGEDRAVRGRRRSESLLNAERGLRGSRGTRAGGSRKMAH